MEKREREDKTATQQLNCNQNASKINETIQVSM